MDAVRKTWAALRCQWRRLRSIDSARHAGSGRAGVQGQERPRARVRGAEKDNWLGVQPPSFGDGTFAQGPEVTFYQWSLGSVG